MPDYEDLRVSYGRDELTETTAPADPWALFETWFVDAEELVEPNAMTLATVDGRGRPHARTVLLKGLLDGPAEGGPAGREPLFYTNNRSDKGCELAVNPACALLFAWLPLERQVRIEGMAHQVEPARSDAYFASRPRGSRIGAWASPQSQVVLDREDLERRHTAIEERYADQEVPRPPYWGGWSVRTTRVEFWQGRRDRLHDRLRYELQRDGGWTRERLGP